jgi:hypothetical protein
MLEAMGRQVTLFSRVALVTALVTALIATIATIGPTTTASADGGDVVFVIGDSLTVGTFPFAARAFDEVGLGTARLNAHGSRGIWFKAADDPTTGLLAVDRLRARYGDSNEWIIALGTNDATRIAPSVYPALITTVLDRIGRGRRVMWVNVYLPNFPEEMTAFNRALATAAAKPGRRASIQTVTAAARIPTTVAVTMSSRTPALAVRPTTPAHAAVAASTARGNGRSRSAAMRGQAGDGTMGAGGRTASGFSRTRGTMANTSRSDASVWPKVSTALTCGDRAP